MVDERPLAGSEIEAELLAELQKLPSLRDTQSVRVRPYSGSKVWTWEPDRIEPEVGPVQIKFADVKDVAAGCSNSMISIPVPKPGHLTLR
jgi:hypothetical protein